MSDVATIARGERMFFMSDGFGIVPKIYAAGGGKKTYSGVAVFRSGSFADSTGMRNTWEPLHIRQMMDNFDYLRNNHILDSVPARDGHPGFLLNNIPGKGEVVGWHEAIKTKTMKSPVDGLEYEYLLVDYTLTQEYAIQKAENGTWRNRSAEIGGYSTNNESDFWPVYLGFAFVDFSAVEGLNFTASTTGGRFFAHIVSPAATSGPKENDNMTQPASGGTQTPVPTDLLLPFTQAAGAAGSDGQHANAQTQPAAPAVQPAAPAAQAAQPFVFSIAGTTTSDFNAVQAYINRLETFTVETKQAARADFVAGLVTSSKILASQKEALTAFAKSLGDEQFAAWSATWETAAPAPVLQNHGGGAGSGTSAPQSVNVDAAEAALRDAEEIVAMHKRSGMPIEKIKQQASYTKLVAANRAPAL
jgi:hypothetical protein